jgi:hypothetical protein
VKSGPDFKGGIVSYGKVINDLKRLLGDTSAAMVTTMLDYFELPNDFPGKQTVPSGTGHQKVTHLEAAFEKDIGHHRFLPYLSLHEFEALLFVSPKHIVEQIPGLKSSINQELLKIKSAFYTPEEIDDEEPPSYRLKALISKYQKTLFGPIIAEAIGIERIRNECPHFDEWVKKLESLTT